MVGTKLGSVVGVPLGTYVDLDLVSLEGSTDGSVNGKFDGLLDQRMGLILKKMKMM